MTKTSTKTKSITNTKILIAVLALFVAGGLAFASLPGKKNDFAPPPGITQQKKQSQKKQGSFSKFIKKQKITKNTNIGKFITPNDGEGDDGHGNEAQGQDISASLTNTLVGEESELTISNILLPDLSDQGEHTSIYFSLPENIKVLLPNDDQIVANGENGAEIPFSCVKRPVSENVISCGKNINNSSETRDVEEKLSFTFDVEIYYAAEDNSLDVDFYIDEERRRLTILAENAATNVSLPNTQSTVADASISLGGNGFGIIGEEFTTEFEIDIVAPVYRGDYIIIDLPLNLRVGGEEPEFVSTNFTNQHGARVLLDCARHDGRGNKVSCVFTGFSNSYVLGTGEIEIAGIQSALVRHSYQGNRSNAGNGNANHDYNGGVQIFRSHNTRTYQDDNLISEGTISFPDTESRIDTTMDVSNDGEMIIHYTVPNHIGFNSYFDITLKRNLDIMEGRQDNISLLRNTSSFFSCNPPIRNNNEEWQIRCQMKTTSPGTYSMVVGGFLKESQRGESMINLKLRDSTYSDLNTLEEGVIIDYSVRDYTN